MIQGFEIVMLWPGLYLVRAIMVDEPSVGIGLFESKAEIDHACDVFAEQFKHKLN